jgi:PAS domain S-box-containing protein
MTPFPDAVSTEDALARLDEVFDLAPSFLAVARGPDHVFERVNRAYTALVGDRPLVGLSVREAMPEVVSQGFIGILDGVYRTGEPLVASELPILLQRGGRDPEQRWVNFVYQPLRGPDGSINGIVAHGVDVTDHVRTRQALADSESHFRSLIENSHDKIAVLSSSGVIRYVSPAVQRLLGWEASEMQGRGALEFIHPDEHPVAMQALGAAVANPDETRQFEHRMLHRDGSWRVFETVGQARRTTIASKS